jgi:DNA-binding response OmpR family regulator
MSDVRILVVDSKEEMAELIKLELETEGYEVFATNCGQKGMELLREVKPHVVLLDIMVGDGQGYEILKSIKDDHKDIAVIIVTATGAETEVQRGLELGADDYIAKPFYSGLFLERIRKRIRNGRHKDVKQDPKILVIDDDTELTQSLTNHLQKKGYRVVGAYSGREGLELIPSISPDLIILDIIMPEMDGYEVLKEIKKKASTKDIIVILLTAKGLDEDIQKGLDLGAADYITKPFPPALLTRRIQDVLSVARE